MSKLTIIGAGSSYTPLLVDHLFSSPLNDFVTEIALMDIDHGKLEVISSFLERVKQAKNGKPVINSYNNLEDALKGTSIIVPQVRVGQMKARQKDEELGRRWNIVGQETTGVGGFAKALRTIPVLKEVAAVAKRVASSDVFIINFTNPVGIVTEALNRYQEIPAIGICNGSLTMQEGIAKKLHRSMEEIEIDYIGPNHFAFVTGVRDSKGNDLFEETRNALLEEIPEAKNITRVRMTPNIIKRCKIIPTGYHKYFFHQAAVIEEDANTETRASKVMEIEKNIFDLYRDPTCNSIPKVVQERGGAFYNVVAIDVIESILGLANKRVTIALSNEGHVEGLDDKHVIELPCLIENKKIIKQKDINVPPFMRSYSSLIKGYEELTAKAAWEGDLDLAYQAMLLNPLLPDADKCEDILDDILKTFEDYLPQFKK